MSNITKSVSPKSYVKATILSAIFGTTGIHHFYLGRYIEGTIDFSMFAATIYFYANGQIGLAILTLAVDSLHTIIITFMLLVGSFTDGKGRRICYPGQKL